MSLSLETSSSVVIFGQLVDAIINQLFALGTNHFFVTFI